MTGHRDPTATPTVTPEMIRLYDDYTHLALDRRAFVTAWAASPAAARPPRRSCRS